MATDVGVVDGHRYRVSGDESRACLTVEGSWAWTGAPLVCAECPPPPSVALTSASCAGGVCAYECGAGTFDSQQRTAGVTSSCSSDSGVWDAVALTCTTCVAPASPAGASRACTSDGGTCTFTCDHGYHRTSGEAQRRCDPRTGDWGMGDALVCGACVAPSAPDHGSRTCDVAGGECSFVCDGGFYQSAGDATRTCDRDSGEWSGSHPECTTCVPPVPLVSAQRACDGASCT